ncbi:MAG: hypothetical protein II871_04990, partial [Clostridia bacterium]|nr:hypothetical protein [Clostridia bacterium]
PRAFIVQYPCFLCGFSAKLIIHESSRPGNPCGSPGLVLLGLNATAPFYRMQSFCRQKLLDINFQAKYIMRNNIDRVGKKCYSSL